MSTAKKKKKKAASKKARSTRSLTVVGWREWVRLPELSSDSIKAKIDTGARSSSLHAFDLELFDRDGAPWARFAVHPRQRSAEGSATVEAPLVDSRSVKSSSGVAEVRPVISTRMQLGGVEREIELTLTRRDDMGFRMLVGRQALRGAFSVAPARSFVTGTPPTADQRPPIQIGGETVQAGTHTLVALPISRLASGAQIALTLQVVHGAAPGPVVWLNGAVHGDEINGIEIVRRVLDELDAKKLRGTVIAVPVVNVYGFVSGDRYLPDRRDLNRSFPGSANGSLAKRVAHLLMTEVVQRCSVGIDLHTGSDGRTNLPQIRASLDDPATAALARAFGCQMMLHAKPPEGSLRHAATKAGATVLLFEGGEAWRFDPGAIQAGTDGVLRVLAALDLIDPVVPTATTRYRGESTRWVRARRSGLAQLDCGVGDLVEKGQVLGRIHDPFGKRLSQLTSPVSGLVIGLKLAPLVNRGDAVVHVATIDPEESV